MSRIPVNQSYTITTQFGVPDPNAKFGKHSGIDYAIPLNRPIYAPCSGKLTNVISNTGGNMVQIFDGKYYHRLMHNNAFSRNNGPVSEGEQVAKAGTTGLSTGVHCHWDVNTESFNPTTFNSFINPDKWLKEGDPVFNEGDRVNWNNLLYGEDLGLHKDLVDKKTFKEALETIRVSTEFLVNGRMNDGDTDNFIRGLTISQPNDNDRTFHRGHTAKFSVYDLIERPDARIKQEAEEYEEVPGPMFKRKTK